MDQLSILREGIEAKIAEKLEGSLTCGEIHELASAYAELSKVAWLPMTYTPSFGCEMHFEKEKN